MVWTLQDPNGGAPFLLTGSSRKWSCSETRSRNNSDILYEHDLSILMGEVILISVAGNPGQAKRSIQRYHCRLGSRFSFEDAAFGGPATFKEQLPITVNIKEGGGWGSHEG